MSNSDDRIRTPTALSDLIAIGKAKGFLTYDDVNDLMPESVISTSEIDAWLSVLGAEVSRLWIGHRVKRTRTRRNLLVP